MKITMRSALITTGACMMLALPAAFAADNAAYPVKPIRLITSGVGGAGEGRGSAERQEGDGCENAHGMSFRECVRVDLLAGLAQMGIRNSPASPRKCEGRPQAARSTATGVQPITCLTFSPRREISARPMPTRRATACWCGGSRPVRIAMNTRLSTPSTTSIAVSVSSAAQASGL